MFLALLSVGLETSALTVERRTTDWPTRPSSGCPEASHGSSGRGGLSVLRDLALGVGWRGVGVRKLSSKTSFCSEAS